MKPLSMKNSSDNGETFNKKRHERLRNMFLKYDPQKMSQRVSVDNDLPTITLADWWAILYAEMQDK